MDGEGGGGHEVAVPEPLPGGQCAQGGGEEPGGEGVARADGGDDLDVEGGDEGDRVAVTVTLEKGCTPGPLLHDQRPGFGQRGADRPRTSGDAPGGLGLVLAHEDEVAAAGQVQQDLARFLVLPEVGPVVDVERDEGAAGAARGEFAHQGEAARGERGGDAGEVEHPPRADGVQVHDVRRHRGGGGTGPVVRDLVGVARPVARRAEVDARRARGIPSYGGGVDAVRGDRLDEVIAEALRADPADPARGVPGRGEHTRHIRLGAADPRSNDGTSARRPGRVGRNVTMDSPSATTSTTVGVTMTGAPRSRGRR